jgi:hypothetical protein
MCARYSYGLPAQTLLLQPPLLLPVDLTTLGLSLRAALKSLPHVVLTSAEDWDPYSKAFTEKEEIAQRCAVIAKERSNQR